MAHANPSDSAKALKAAAAGDTDQASMDTRSDVGSGKRSLLLAAGAAAAALLLLAGGAAVFPARATDGGVGSAVEAAFPADGTSDASPEPEDVQAMLQIRAPAAAATAEKKKRTRDPMEEVEDVLSGLNADSGLKKAMATPGFSWEGVLSPRVQSMSPEARSAMKVMAAGAAANKSRCNPHLGVWKGFDEWSVCNSTTTIYCPSTHAELQEIVKNHAQVRTTGMGHSWTPFTCTSGSFASDSATIDMKSFNTILGIDTNRSVVRVQAGVTFRDVLSYLAEYKYKLLSWSFFVDQTVAGAVSTGTHGSDLQPGRQTTSALARTLTLVKADGSIVKVDRDQDPELMKAAAISVGKMGVIIELELDIEPDHCILSEVHTWSQNGFIDFLKQMKDGDETLTGNWSRGEEPMNIYWSPFSQQVTGGKNRKNPPGCVPHEKSTWVEEAIVDMLTLLRMDRAVGSMYSTFRKNNLRAAEFQADLLTKAGTFCTEGCWASSGRLINSYIYSKIIVPVWRYTQFEFAIPFDKAADCFGTFLKNYVKDDTDKGLFGGEPALLRFVGQADQLLGATTDGPRIFFNADIDVHFRPHSEEECTKWDSIVQHFLSDTCDARYHFGKGGWEELDADRIEKMYPKLPEFREVMKKWDPSGKFRGSSPVFVPEKEVQKVGKCVPTSPAYKEFCASAERQATLCMCTANDPHHWNWGTAPCEWQVMQKVPDLPDETLQCIERRATQNPLRTMLDIFMTPTWAEHNHRRGPRRGATACSVVPQSGFFKGFAGPDNGNYELQPEMWQGIVLKTCNEGSDKDCTSRSAINYFRIHTEMSSFFHGNWTTTKSWVDGKPASLITYPEEMPKARNELRPWCVCGVKTYLGLLFWNQTEAAARLNAYPNISFLLVPPDAKANDCPAVESEATMCKP